MDQKESTDGEDLKNGNYTLVNATENPHLGIYDKPLPCFGCGIGWFFIPFTLEDISKSVQQIEVPEIDPPPLIRENSGFSFLLQRSE